MKSLLAALLALLVLASPAVAVVDWHELGADAEVVARSATTVTLHVEQTSGPTVKLTVYHYCYQGQVFAYTQKATVYDQGNVTFNTGERRGRTPTECWAMVEYVMPSQTTAILYYLPTLP